jgi:glycolate oxidase iron-sulfur subunit
MSREQAQKCGKCGFCLAVCPVYSVMSEEQASPRAKIQLIRAFDEGKLESSGMLKDIMTKCLMCGSCTAACPSEVEHYPQFMRMRSEMIRDHGEKVEIRGLIYMLANQSRLKIAASLAKVGQSVAPKFVTEKCSVGYIPVSRLPQLHGRSFRARIGRVAEPAGECRGEVLYFTGCATNYLFPDTGFATVRLLNRMGYRVIIPDTQVCCSVPMLLHGAEDQAKENVLANVECLGREDVEAVIVDCPTCGSTIKNEYPKIIEKFAGDRERATLISQKTIDIMSFVHDRWELLGLEESKAVKNARVTYHAPCHLKNVFASSERVLEKLKGITYLPVPDRMECCGGGGTFFFEYPEISSVLARRKVKSAEKSGADVWLTDCPVCRINLDGHQTVERPLKCMHPVEFLDSIQ